MLYRPLTFRTKTHITTNQITSKTNEIDSIPISDNSLHPEQGIKRWSGEKDNAEWTHLEPQILISFLAKLKSDHIELFLAT